MQKTAAFRKVAAISEYELQLVDEAAGRVGAVVGVAAAVSVQVIKGYLDKQFDKLAGNDVAPHETFTGVY